jgi:hypothetical protein
MANINCTTYNISSGTFDLNGDTINCTSTFTSTGGTFIANTGNLFANVYTISGGTINMGNGIWTGVGTGNVWNVSGSTVINSNNSTILISNNSTTTRTFIGGNKNYNIVNIGGTGICTTIITGSNRFENLISQKTTSHTINIASTQTINSFGIYGTSSARVTIQGDAGIGTFAANAAANGVVSGTDYIDFNQLTFTPLPSATQKYSFYVGKNSRFTTYVTGGALKTNNTNIKAYHILPTQSTSGNWTVPNDWNPLNNSIQLLGGGGGGAGGSFTTATGGKTSGGGGGGGGFSVANNVSLTPGSTVAYVIGQGGVNGGAIGASSAGGDGGNTIFGSYSAGGGKAGTSNYLNGGYGGVGGTGTKFRGGAGGYDFSTNDDSRRGAGGGGAGGYLNIGQDGQNVVLSNTTYYGGYAQSNSALYAQSSILGTPWFGDGSNLIRITTTNQVVVGDTVSSTYYGGGGVGGGCTKGSASGTNGLRGAPGWIFIQYDTTPRSNNNSNMFLVY